jgi:ABC-type multidrug transport system ATPase subunit
MTNSSGTKTVFGNNSSENTPYVILNNQGESISLTLNRPHHSLGRDPQQVDLIVPPTWTVISRFQATLRQQGNEYHIYDGDGINPTLNKLFINNKLITPRDGYVLHHSDEIKIGQDPKTWVILTYFDPKTGQVAKPPSQKSIAVKNRSVSLGRDASVDLQLDAPTVSRTHAIITSSPQGGYTLQDRSINGVFVNGQKVSGSIALTPNSLIKIGPYTLVLQGDELVLADRGQNIRLDAENVFRMVKDKKGRDIRILNNISLPIEPGQLVALVGGSGAGKSTLMKTLLGIEPTTGGKVYLNGEDLRKNFNIYRTQIGYVPQSDIVHKDLTVGEVLYYAAKLRLSPDINVAETIEKTLSQVELTERRDTLVKDLSGGQLKRVSIAVELLADPKLFFLDEPTSGLDPGLDKKMMLLLAKLADEGRTVVLVTHATTNIKLCDRLVFLGRGGNLCYFGPPLEASEFFRIENSDFADIYINLESKEAVERETEVYRNSHYHKDYVENRLTKGTTEGSVQPQQVKRSFWQQLSILTQRYFKLTLRDPVNIALALLTAPIGIALITLAIGNQNPLFLPPEAKFDDAFKAAPFALKVLFVFTCACLWVGLSTSLQEIVKETEIYLRERLVNLRIFAYLASKLLVLKGLGLIQTILITIAICIGFKAPVNNPQIFIPWALGIAITTFLTLFTAMCLGLMVSAWVKNSTQANSALPLLLLPQIIFAGVLFNIENIGVRIISWLMVSRWSVGAYGVLVGIADMIQQVKDTNKYYVLNTQYGITLPLSDTLKVYGDSMNNLFLNWGILLAHSIIYLSVTFWLQKRKDVL